MVESAPLLDAHVHFWDAATTPRTVSPLVRALGWSPRLLDFVARRAFPSSQLAFYGTPEHILRRYDPEKYTCEAKSRSALGVVHVQSDWTEGGPLGPVGETRWVAGLGHAFGTAPILAIVAHADLSLGEEVGEVLDAHTSASDRVRGIRDLLLWHPNPGVVSAARAGDLVDDVAWRRGFEAVVARDLTFDVGCYGDQLDDVAALAEAYPEARIALCHLGLPVAIGGPYAGLGVTPAERQAIRSRWQDALTRLAEQPGVVVKLSGLVMPVLGFGFERLAEPPTLERVQDAVGPLLRTALDLFGPERCMIGSNMPVDKAAVPYGTLLGAYEQALAHLDATSQQRVFAGTAASFYRIDLPSDEGST